MRRAIYTVLLSLLVLCVAACDQAPAETAAAEPMLLEEWLSRWEAGGYPDDVGGAYYDSERSLYVLMLTGADERQQRTYQELLAGEFAIEQCAYSMNELTAVQADIERRMQRDERIYSVGVGWAMRDGEGPGFGPGGHEFRVVVSVDKAALAQYRTELEADYGEKVFVQGSDPVRLDG